MHAGTKAISALSSVTFICKPAFQFCHSGPATCYTRVRRNGWRRACGDVVEIRIGSGLKENARGTDEKEGRTHEVPENDVPDEYLGEGPTKSGLGKSARAAPR